MKTQMSNFANASAVDGKISSLIKIPCCHRRKLVWLRQTDQVLSQSSSKCRPSHAESGHADAIAVNSETMGHIVQQPQQGIRLPYFSLSTLGRNKNERKIWINSTSFGGPCTLTFSKSFPARYPVKEKEKRPFRGRQTFRNPKVGTGDNHKRPFCNTPSYR